MNNDTHCSFLTCLVVAVISLAPTVASNAATPTTTCAPLAVTSIRINPSHQDPASALSQFVKDLGSWRDGFFVTEQQKDGSVQTPTPEKLSEVIDAKTVILLGTAKAKALISGPKLTSADMPLVTPEIKCTPTGLQITAHITRIGNVNVDLIRNVSWSPMVELDLTSIQDETDYTIAIKWVLHATGSLSQRHWTDKSETQTWEAHKTIRFLKSAEVP